MARYLVYGATGYTGRLVAEYLAHHYKSKGPKWAMAGRSAEREAALRKRRALARRGHRR